MKALPTKTKRLHALDALRGIMMLLGIVLHSALTYSVTPHGDAWSIKDPNSTSLATDFLVLLIHIFRMPLFFMVAGFFGALLFYERSALKMIKNRFSRIVLPFLVFLILLWPVIVFAFGYTHGVFLAKPKPLSHALRMLSSTQDLIPKSTSHLWFLYYLMLITIATVLIALLLRTLPILKIKTKAVFKAILKNPLIRIISLATIVGLLLKVFGSSMVATSVSLVPDYQTFSYYFIFYFLGWLVYISKEPLTLFVKYSWLTTSLAVGLSIVEGLVITAYNLNPSGNSNLLIAFNAIIVSLFIFGLTGLFVRYASTHSPKLRYISDASYWVYLIHLPITVLIPAALADLPLPALIKFFIVILVTGVICFVSYHYLVRNTFIGKFLNGKKYPLKAAKG
ncbi:acyltransferase family protein [Croceivirga sp. JEA036]|uniref:acyltransferase family protein n=1 Tax=Croceivirga sp. JEA036 TaxID=2721162 RepID=UPI001FD7552C|nr:acyltransferase family protein [Croceivirga sp. JEA036]